MFFKPYAKRKLETVGKHRRIDGVHTAGKAPHLPRHIRALGEETAMDLLLRLLAFDPRRRCTAEEALCHEYLVDLENEDAMLGESAARMPEFFMAQYMVL